MEAHYWQCDKHIWKFLMISSTWIWLDYLPLPVLMIFLLKQKGKQYYSFGEDEEFVCFTGFDLEGFQFINCLPDGTWSQPKGRCLSKSAFSALQCEIIRPCSYIFHNARNTLNTCLLQFKRSPAFPWKSQMTWSCSPPKRHMQLVNQWVWTAMSRGLCHNHSVSTDAATASRGSRRYLLTCAAPMVGFSTWAKEMVTLLVLLSPIFKFPHKWTIRKILSKQYLCHSHGHNIWQKFIDYNAFIQIWKSPYTCV